MKAPLVLLFIVAATSTAVAGSVTLAFDDFGEPLVPLSGTRVVEGTATAPCLVDANGTAAPVVFSVTGPEFAQVRVSPASYFPPSDCASGSSSTQVRLTVRFTADAPALARVPVTVSARVENATERAEAAETIAVVPGFFSVLDVALAETVKVGEPQSVVSFPMNVTNLGNGRTKVFFEITESPRAASVATPLPIILGARGEPDSAAVVMLTAITPYRTGYLDERGSITITTSSHFALDPALKGDSASVSVVLGTKGFHVPSVPAVWGVLGLAAVAILRRR